MRYALNERPGIGPLVVYGLQWWVVSLPSIVILGMVSSRLYGTGLDAQIWSMRKLFWLVGAVSAAQVLWGHRLPLVPGPAATLLVGMIAAGGDGEAATYTAIFAGGVLLSLAAACGLLSRLRFFFTPRIVAVILMLIAFTLTPTMLALILPGPEHQGFHLCFALCGVGVLIVCNRALPGMWKSLTVLVGLAGGTLAYALWPGLPEAAGAAGAAGGDFSWFIAGPDLRAGPLLAFLFCFLALTINELGSIESIGQMLGADDMPGRIRRGAGLQGAANMAAGALGVIGPVDYSLSAGLIGATGCASRYTLLPMSLGLAVCGFFPDAIRLLARVPGPVMGMLMLYLMASQLSGSLTMLHSGQAGQGAADFTGGLIVGFPLMIGLVIGFAPAGAFAGFPTFLRPIVGNGFVMGALAVIVLEHLVFRSKGGA